MFATQLNNWANYRGSVFYFGKNTFSFLAFSCSLSKLCRSNQSYVFFGASTLVDALFILRRNKMKNEDRNYYDRVLIRFLGMAVRDSISERIREKHRELPRGTDILPPECEYSYEAIYRFYYKKLETKRAELTSRYDALSIPDRKNYLFYKYLFILSDALRDGLIEMHKLKYRTADKKSFKWTSKLVLKFQTEGRKIYIACLDRSLY